MAEWWEEFYADPDFLLAVNLPSPAETAEEVHFLDGILRGRRAARVLDLGCGLGRHAIPLAQLGYWVVGLDYSAYYLAEARRAAAERAVTPSFLRADMRCLPFAESAFDAALSMLTTFGYFPTRTEDAALLAAIYEVLAPGGILILDVTHREHLARHFVDGEHHWAIPCGRGVHLENHYRLAEDLGRVELVSLLVREGVIIKRSGFSIRLYSYGELVEMLQGAGFAICGLWGDYDGSEFGPSSSRLILAGEKCPSG